MADILGGILSRDGFAGNPTDQFSNSTLMLALDIGRFVPLADAAGEATKAADHMVNTPLAEGSYGVMYPGQKEIKTRKERGKQGVDIEQETWNEMLGLVREFNLEETLGPLPE
jgi:LDH2 family malate/lactate/ureidoglycolate dehydrogenase